MWPSGDWSQTIATAKPRDSAVVCIHGLIGDAINCDLHLAALQKQWPGVRMYVPDVLGSGQHSLDALRSQITALLDDIPETRVALLGFRNGGRAVVSVDHDKVCARIAVAAPLDGAMWASVAAWLGVGPVVLAEYGVVPPTPVRPSPVVRVAFSMDPSVVQLHLDFANKHCEFWLDYRDEDAMAQYAADVEFVRRAQLHYLSFYEKPAKVNQ